MTKTPLRLMVACLLCASLAGAAAAQTVDEILAKNYQARGGLDKIKALTTMKMIGRLSAQGAELVATTWAKRPNLMRQEMELQGRTIVQAFDGTRGWAINPMMGTNEVIELPAAQTELLRTSGDFDGPLVDYKAKGYTIELDGTDTVDGAKVVKLKVTRKTGAPLVLYLDAETGLERKTTTQVEQGGQKVSIEAVMSNYRAVSGIQVPFSVQRYVNGQLAARVAIDSVEFNTPMEDGLFKMPGK